MPTAGLSCSEVTMLTSQPQCRLTGFVERHDVEEREEFMADNVQSYHHHYMTVEKLLQLI